jgi:hypothetical protein
MSYDTVPPNPTPPVVKTADKTVVRGDAEPWALRNKCKIRNGTRRLYRMNVATGLVEQPQTIPGGRRGDVLAMRVPLSANAIRHPLASTG